MRLLFRLLLVLLNYIGCLEAYAQVREFNLASETEWTLRIDGGEAQPIIVPGGGWNSDLQTSKIHVLKDVYNYVDYEREMDIPLLYDNQNVILKFGAVNYGAEIYVDHSFVSTHAGSQIPFDIDITKFVKGKSNVHLLVRAYHRRYYDREGVNILPVGWEWPEGSSGTPWEWQSNAPDTLSKMGYGITKYIKMAVCPESFIEDVFIRPSVSSQSLSYDVWIHNGSSKDKTYTLSSVLSSWNNDNWTYPEICKKEFSVKAFSTEKISINNIPWTLGENSYWWPNIPFNESYQAKLHYLNFDLVSDGVLLHKHSQRFGFCEHSEGKYYYMVNNVRVNGLGDGTAENQMSYYDCYSTAPAFLPPTDSTLGCPESWKRYMRIGFNSLRLHCSLPTQYMMDVADELGLMLIPEAPIWGNNLCKYHSVYTPQTIKAMIKFCRNHPSVVRYSLTNEVREPMTDDWPWKGLIDAALEVDDTRPLVYELHNFINYNVIKGNKKGHACVMHHYAPPVKTNNTFIKGMGEQFWGTNKMEEFALGVRKFRLYDYAYVAPWSWINYWPNFLEGMSHEQHAWKPNNHQDRVDGVDGWNSTVVKKVMEGLHPYLVVDASKMLENPTEAIPIENSSENSDQDNINYTDSLQSGSQLYKVFEVFNGSLSDGYFCLKWTLSSNMGLIYEEGSSEPFFIKAGFHVPIRLLIKTPVNISKCNLQVNSLKDGNIVYSYKSNVLLNK